MFDALSDRFEGIFARVRNRGRLSEADVDEVLREIRLALLEADVNLTVVKSLVGRIRERCVGEELSKALSPAQQVIKIVNEELTATLGGETVRITYASKPPTVVLMAGLQGSGKTTNSAKLARWFKSQGRNPLLVGADLQRPAAVAQLRTLGQQVEVPVFSEATDPVSVARAGVAEAKRKGRDVVIVDTAGRLAIDAELMDEVRRISEAVEPRYTFLVVDAMTGQDAVNTAESFHQTLELDGVILTKLDGDARGGAALSVKEVVGRPIVFASTGEKLKDFDLFHPDRLAGRILGMGDMLTLIEKAEEVYEHDEAEAAAAKLLEGKFTLDDFLGPDAAGQEDGLAQGHAQAAAGHAQGDARRRDRPQGDRPHRGHHPVDDQRGAHPPRAHRGVAARPHRQRLGHHARRGRRAHQAVQGDEQDDEPDGRVRFQAHGQEEPQERQERQARGGRGRGSGGGRVTEGRAPLRLPDLDLSKLAAGGPGAGPGLDGLPDLDGPGGLGLN